MVLRLDKIVLFNILQFIFLIKFKAFQEIMKFLSGKVGAKLKINWIRIICNRFDLPHLAILILNVESLY